MVAPKHSDAQIRGDRMIGARAHFCAGHTLPQHPKPHGHSYEVWAFEKEGGCVEDLQRRLQAVCAELDHTMLEPNLSTMEDIARYVGRMLSFRDVGPCKVRIIRPVEGLCAEIDSF